MTNYSKWSFFFGIPLAIVGTIVAIIRVPDIGCKVGWNVDACVVPQKEAELITQAQTGEFLPGVKIQFIAKGAPVVQYTDNNGYAKVQIPSKGDVRVNLSKEGYPTQEFTLNLENPQSTVTTIRFNQSGKPDLVQAPVTPPPNPNPSTPPTPSQSPTTPDISASTLLQTDCQSNTPGGSLERILGKRDKFPVTLGREVLPLFVFIQDWYYSGNSIIYRERPLEFVCNLKSSYNELKLVYGIHGGNSLASPDNKITFSIFLDSKLVGAKTVVVGAKQEWILPLQGVKNVSLRTECTVEKCPTLSFTEMSLK